MHTYDANVVVHIDESLSNHQISDMEKSLAGMSGILSACVHEKTPHLMVIDYDPRTVESTALLQHIRGTGLHAELIGGV